MAIFIDALSWTLILCGAFFAVVSGIGLLRMPDFYTRVHALGLADTLGAIPILLGLMLQAGLSLASVKLLFIGLFLLFTSPVSAYALAQAALADGLEPRLQEEPPPSSF